MTGSHILQELTLLRNAFDVATALELAEASKQREISLCGLAADDTEADFSGQGLNLADTVLIAAALQFRSGLTEANLSSNALGLEGARALVRGGAFSGALTKCHLRDNALGVEGWTVILEALCDLPDSKIAEWDITGEVRLTDSDADACCVPNPRSTHYPAVVLDASTGFGTYNCGAAGQVLDLQQCHRNVDRMQTARERSWRGGLDYSVAGTVQPPGQQD